MTTGVTGSGDPFEASDADAPRPAPLPASRVFPCTGCGASLRFDPGVGALVCSNCGTRNEVPVDPIAATAALEELDYLTFLRDQAGNEPELDRQYVTCPQCGAETTLEAGVVADACAFCAMPLVSVAAHHGRRIRPRGVVPFAIDHARARETFRRWIGGLWFAPNALKASVRNVDAIRGVYLPCWTFDARTTTEYTGQRGIDRHVQETTRHAQGETVVVTRTITDWYPASGVVHVAFDDELVPASRSIPEGLAGVLQGWDIGTLRPFADEYTAGFTMEAYQLGLEPAFDLAKTAFAGRIEGAIRADIGGNHQRVHDTRTHYDGVTFKHILLPAWICSYRFRDRPWQVVVNGQNGDIRGDRPWSPWKIGFLVLVIAMVVAIVAILNGQ
jgi:hypothetical protein